MKVDVILGLQWGDEGKGKIVDVYTPAYDIIARFQGGPNAGHTIIFGNRKYILHTIPSGIFHPDTINIIGNGVIIDPLILFREIDRLREVNLEPSANMLISNRAHLILPSHRMLDAALESQKGNQKIGSTLKGIGPCYTDKYGRRGIRTGDIFLSTFDHRYQSLKEEHLALVRATGADLSGLKLDGLAPAEYEKLWMDSVARLRELQITDTETFINKSLDNGLKILAEGAQGTMLDVDFGSYPFVTSSNTVTAGVCSGLGIAPGRVGRVYGVFKAYCTRVGSGPFPTELFDDTGEAMRVAGNEFGSTTGRPRRCGWLDLPALKHACMINGVDELIMMKADVLGGFPEISVCTAYSREGANIADFPYDMQDSDIQPVYSTFTGWTSSLDQCSGHEDLPAELSTYIRFIENETGRKVTTVSTGPDRVQTLRL